MKLLRIITFLFIIFAVQLTAEDDLQKLFQNAMEEGISVDLRNPEIRGSTLSTHEGGIIVAPGMRIQARTITYTRIKEEDEEKIFLVASGDLIFDYGSYHLVGDTLTYDFITKTGTLTDGRGGYEMWYFGGTLIELYPDYSLRVHDLYLTTSDSLDADWQLTAQEATLSPNKDLRATHLRLVIEDTKTLWLPTFKTNLDWLANNPIRYRLRWGGKQGIRLGITYLAFDWRRWKTFLRFDYRVDRGPGGGIETLWESEDGKQYLHTINYIARDSSVENTGQRTRYRLEGGYLGLYDQDRTSVELSYDHVSDEEMPDDYYDKGLAHKTVQRTHLHVRRQQEQWWIANFSTRVRINDFQSVKQELPYITWSHHPWEISRSGIIAENSVSAGFLDFVYAEDLEEKNFHSARGEWHGKLYRPLHLGVLTATPFIEGLSIYYGNNPLGPSQWLNTSIFGGELKTSFNKKYHCYKHIIEPYGLYQQVNPPSLEPAQHYIFDVDDGWHALKTLRFGIRQHLYQQTPSHFSRIFSADIYGYAFYDNNRNPTKLPRVFADLLWNVTPYIAASVDTSWDLARHDVGYINTLLKWTLDDDFAFTAEYRHRNAYTWRKADYFNFMMEASTSDDLLAASELSDRRDTFLLHSFYRFIPNWTAEFEYRRGWKRKDPEQKNYVEYQLDVTTLLRSQWQLRLSWQNREDDHRIVFYISLPNNRP